MTYQELLDEVSALGFEDGVENEGQFRFAANRAQKQIFSELPDRRTLKIRSAGAKCLVLHKPVLLAPGEELTVAVPEGGISFTVGGRGNLSYSVSGAPDVFWFDRDGQTERRVFSSPGSLTVTADGYVSVSEIAHYRGSFSRAEDVPDGAAMKEIDLSADCTDFLRCDGLPTDSEGAPVPGALVRGRFLYLPEGFSGTVSVPYCRKPEPLTGDDRDENVDIPDGVSFLLPLLTAAYLWLDSDAEKATYYMTLYRDGATRIRNSLHKTLCASFSDVLHWA